MTIAEVYEKYKHHDEQLTRWLADGEGRSYEQRFLAELWDAIKALIAFHELNDALAKKRMEIEK